MDFNSFKGKLVKGTADFDLDSVSQDAEIGIYFSAHWCPPCRGFTPELIAYYNSRQGGGKPLEIIFVSSDRDDEAFKDYFSTMPWAAVKFSEKECIQEVKQKFGIRGIPTLIILNRKGEVITTDGRSLVGQNVPQFQK